MNRLLIVTAALLAAVGMARASCDGIDNCLGIYFDEDGWTQTCFEPVVGEPFQAYFVFQNSTIDALGGFEFGWRYWPALDPEPVILSMILPPNYPDSDDVHSIIYGGGVPLAADGPVVFMELILLVLDPVAADLQLGPATPASLPGYAAINDFDNPSYIIPINFPCAVDDEGWTVPGVAQLGDCPVAVEGASWGAIKALYR